MGDWGFSALDEVIVRMRLSKFRGGRMSLEFTYVKADRPDEIVATGAQEVYCKARRGEAWFPRPFPAPLVTALMKFADREDLQAALRDALAFHAQDKERAG